MTSIFVPGQSIETQTGDVSLFWVSSDQQWALSLCGQIFWSMHNEAWTTISSTLGQVPGIAKHLHDFTHEKTEVSVWAGPEDGVPLSLLDWRKLPKLDILEALQVLAWTICAIHEKNIYLGGVLPEELLWDEDRHIFWITGFPRANKVHRILPKMIWKDTRTIIALLYDYFMEEPHPGSDKMVVFLQDRSFQQRKGLLQPGLAQILANSATAEGDTSYQHTIELAQDLERLLFESIEPMSVHVGSRSTMGNYVFRRDNQDACGHVLLQKTVDSKKQTHGFFCIADGIGGIDHGGRASELAIDEAHATFVRAWRHYSASTLKSHPSLIAKGIAKVVSQKMALYGEFDAKDNRGGTTFTGLLLADDRIGLAHIGDSWAGIHRDGVLHDLTEPHTVATILAQLEEHAHVAEDKDHVSHRTISRFLTTAHEIELARIDGFAKNVHLALEPNEENNQDITTFSPERLTLKREDIILMASDGLFAELDRAMIVEEIMRYGSSPQTLCDKLVDRALEHVSRDNVTVMAILIS